MLQYVAQLLLDLMFMNERQAKTGLADIPKCLRDRQAQPL